MTTETRAYVVLYRRHPSYSDCPWETEVREHAITAYSAEDAVYQFQLSRHEMGIHVMIVGVTPAAEAMKP